MPIMFTAISEDLERTIYQLKVKPSTKLVAIYITTHYHRKQHNMTASIRKIADDIGICKNTVQNGINELVKVGWLKVDKHVGKGKYGGDYNSYIPDIHVTKDNLLVPRNGTSTCTKKWDKAVPNIGTITISNNNTSSETTSLQKIVSTTTENKTPVSEHSVLIDKTNLTTEVQRPAAVGEVIKVNRKCECGSQLAYGNRLYFVVDLYALINHPDGKRDKNGKLYCTEGYSVVIYRRCLKCGTFHQTTDFREIEIRRLPNRLSDDGCSYVKPTKEEKISYIMQQEWATKRIETGFLLIQLPGKYDETDNPLKDWRNIEGDEWYSNHSRPKYKILDYDVKELANCCS